MKKMVVPEEMEQVSVPVSYYDRAFLSEIGGKDAARWISQHFASFVPELAQRIREHIPQNVALTDRTVPHTQQPFVSEAVIDFIGTGDFSVSPRLPISHLLAYLYCSDESLTPEKLVFGEGRSVLLPQYLEALCSTAAALPDSLFSDLIDGLEDAQDLSNNPCYTLFLRMGEIADYYRTTVRTLFSPLVYCMWIFKTGLKLLEGSNPMTASLSYNKRCPSQPDTEANYSYRTAMLATIIASVYDISLDYLLIRDYSQLAVMKSRSLTAKERRFLSAYLSADVTAQKKTIAKLFVCIART